MDDNTSDAPEPDRQPGDAASDGRPLVASAAGANTPWVWVASALLAGALIFVGLTTQRLNGGAEGSATLLSAAAPGAVISVPPPPPELVAAESEGRGSAFASSPPVQIFADATPPALTANAGQTVTSPDPVAEEQRRKAPALIVDLAAVAPLASATKSAATDASGRPGPSNLNGDEQFAARMGDSSNVDISRATAMYKPQTMVTQGTMIPGVLETAMNSDLPGFVRAVVSRDVRGFDGSTVLIPRGSRLIGQYRSGMALGQSRAFVIWSRILRPDGASIQISSSGTDQLGRAGLDGDVNRHFFERFSGAILLSVLSAAVTSVGDQPSTQIVIGSTNDAATLASGAIAPTNISPTIRVPQGSPVRIFVARDLDFSTVQNSGP